VQKIDDQLHACVVAIKGTLVSPQTPSWIDDRTHKGVRLDHLLGLGVEVTTNEGVATWVGSPYQDHARVSFAVKIGKSWPKSKNKDEEEMVSKDISKTLVGHQPPN
jgi:hypothetical protein